MVKLKSLGYIALVAIALLLPLKASAYEYDAKEGKWIARAKVGGFFGDSKDNETSNGIDYGNSRIGTGDHFFGSNFYAEIEADYFLYDHFSLGSFVGYMPQTGGSWTFGSTTDTGKVDVIPLGVMAKFHIAPYGQIRPYVGAGYYYAIIHSSYSLINYDTSASGGIISGGLDWWFDKDWALNLEAKQYMMKIDVDTSKLSTENNDIVKSEVNPLALTFGITHRF